MVLYCVAAVCYYTVVYYIIMLSCLCWFCRVRREANVAGESQTLVVSLGSTSNSSNSVWIDRGLFSTFKLIWTPEFDIKPNIDFIRARIRTVNLQRLAALIEGC